MAQSTNQQNVGSAHFMAALDAFLAGRVADGVGELQKAGELFASVQLWPPVEAALEWAADGAVLLGDPAAAAPLARVLDAAPASSVTRMHRVHAGRIRAFSAADEGEAADAFAEALAAARSLGRRPHIARVLADYGAWLVACGREAEGEPLLEEARELFEPMGARRWLERIDSVRPVAV